MAKVDENVRVQTLDTWFDPLEMFRQITPNGIVNKKIVLNKSELHVEEGTNKDGGSGAKHNGTNGTNGTGNLERSLEEPGAGKTNAETHKNTVPVVTETITHPLEVAPVQSRVVLQGPMSVDEANLHASGRSDSSVKAPPPNAEFGNTGLEVLADSDGSFENINANDLGDMDDPMDLSNLEKPRQAEDGPDSKRLKASNGSTGAASDIHATFNTNSSIYSSSVNGPEEGVLPPRFEDSAPGKIDSVDKFLSQPADVVHPHPKDTEIDQALARTPSTHPSHAA